MKNGDIQMKRNSFFKADLLILSVLNRKDCYGYEIASIIENDSDGRILLKEGVMYPILHRLLEEGDITSYEEMVNRKLRVYYHLEEKGRKTLNDLEKDFFLKFDSIVRIIKNK